MLVALTDQNERFVVNTSISSTTLKKIRLTTQFFCPQCKERLQFKIGTVKIPHFAHYSKSTCDTYFSEGESEQHLLGKQQLLNFFQSKHLQVELEPYLRTVKQRPDLLVQKDGTNFAIEFQCSPIQQEMLSKRNRGYRNVSLKPIWIPITNENHQLEGIRKISISKQLQQFIQTTRHQQFIMTYHPTTNKFYYLSNLMYVQRNTYLSKIIPIQANAQHFPFYIPKRLTKREFVQYVNAYNSMKQHYLSYRVLISRKGVNDLFLRSVYELKLQLTALPNFIGVLLKGNDSLRIFSVEWQTILFYFLHVNQLTIHSLNDQAIHYFLKWAKLPETNRAHATVMEYCKIIRALNIQSLDHSLSSELLIDQLYSQILANEVKS